MVKKSFWLEEDHAKAIELTAKKLKITESAVIRGLIEEMKKLPPK